MIQRHTSSYQRSQGAVLIVALILLLAMTIIGVSAIDTTTMESQMSRNSQEANNRYQVTVNEIEGHIRYMAQSLNYRESIVSSTTAIDASTIIGVTNSGRGLILADSNMRTSDGTDTGSDNYTLNGYAVFSGFYTGAYHGYSLGKFKHMPVELNVRTTLTGTRSVTDHTQAALFPAPGEG